MTATDTTATCVECGELPACAKSKLFPGLCCRCRKTALRRCLHCRGEKPIHARGLCRTCYLKPEVREIYPPQPNPGANAGAGSRFPEGGSAGWHEPTMDELDALVAEQFKPENLPDWWESECERVRRGTA